LTTAKVIYFINSEIVTRSISKHSNILTQQEPEQYTSVTFPAKAIKLLICEYLMQQGNSNTHVNGALRKHEMEEYVIEAGYESGDDGEWMEAPDDFEHGFFNDDDEGGGIKVSFLDRDDPIFKIDCRVFV
jgi:hypothetical protein